MITWLIACRYIDIRLRSIISPVLTPNDCDVGRELYEQLIDRLRTYDQRQQHCATRDMTLCIAIRCPELRVLPTLLLLSVKWRSGTRSHTLDVIGSCRAPHLLIHIHLLDFAQYLSDKGNFNIIKQNVQRSMAHNVKKIAFCANYFLCRLQKLGYTYVRVEITVKSLRNDSTTSISH